MSDTIRELLRLRQSGRPIDLDMIKAILGSEANALERVDGSSPIPSDDLLSELVASLTGPSMASQIVEQSGRGEERTLQSALNKGDQSQLMRPMISSVMQLDR